MQQAVYNSSTKAKKDNPLAKLYFSYAAMNAGKSTVLLQASHNYRERGMDTFILTAALDDRAGQGKVASRIGLDADACLFEQSSDLFDAVQSRQQAGPLHCVLVDEAQFLSEQQVWALAKVTDELGVPVLCYGLRTDFQGKLFPGSAALLAIADSLREIRTICWCGCKATMVLRLDSSGVPLDEGNQVDIGGNERYVSVCRSHWVRRETEDVK
ncbi:Thymidine kinase [hydrothermal vent metagenome]|uniref:thymidine kinase n=1 Tax=hydrothermal vent metagenome TaxID=652676 RepID=A0A3B0SNX0_9ZZZZ